MQAVGGLPEEHTKTTGKKTPLYFIAFALVMIMTLSALFGSHLYI